MAMQRLPPSVLESAVSPHTPPYVDPMTLRRSPSIKTIGGCSFFPSLPDGSKGVEGKRQLSTTRAIRTRLVKRRQSIQDVLIPDPHRVQHSPGLHGSKTVLHDSIGITHAGNLCTSNIFSISVYKTQYHSLFRFSFKKTAI